MSNMASCRYCGQACLPDKDYSTQTEADEYATLRCDCTEAKRYQAEEKRKAERQKNIENIKNSIEGFDGYCTHRNAALSDEIKTALFSNAILVLDGLIESSSIKFDRVNAKINQNQKGNVVLSFSYSDSAKMEV